MNEAKKVTLPRDVAEAIEESRESFTGGEIVSAAVGWNDYDERSLKLIRKWVQEDPYDARQELIMSALVNGFTIEQSPEEKLREYYEKINRTKYGTYGTARAECVIEGIEKTLSILGIQIEGINTK
ncbi:DUF1642 domain-containing protein [Cytobacillus purgationiresistens]|uniref:DUF1642 domain-containing protein n=1 Tax=Cytobacillus purgationiresistens TaxID=863449 RepID=A0ABU0AJ60_9BACI|nr:DUF1642 domain-containing protein [Cytobacillus purgationiresistens]MDQ0270802.1 hypothetical protein [Cytobacillus purgationiresistens]